MFSWNNFYLEKNVTWSGKQENVLQNYPYIQLAIGNSECVTLKGIGVADGIKVVNKLILK